MYLSTATTKDMNGLANISNDDYTYARCLRQFDGDNLVWTVAKVDAVSFGAATVAATNNIGRMTHCVLEVAYGPEWVDDEPRAKWNDIDAGAGRPKLVQ